MVQLIRVDHDPFGETKEVYVIRHGSTALNSQDGGTDRIRGWRDVPLSDKGGKEIAATAEKLAGSGLQVLVHSDLQRARDTAHAIARTTGAHSIPSPALRPWNVGHFTGRDSNIVTPMLREYVCEQSDKVIPGGESFDQFRDRVFAGIKQALQIAEHQKLGLVTHHRVDRLLAAWEKKDQPDDFSIDPNVMFTHGEPPASWREVMMDLRPFGIGGASATRGPRLQPVDHDPFVGA